VSARTDRLAAGLHAYRQLGPLRGTVAVARHAVRAGRGHTRRLIVERRPIQASAAEVTAALGGGDLVAAVLATGDALPSLQRWAGELGTLNEAERERLLAVADGVVAHRFDLLGSGPTDLGDQIDWHTDFKSGRRWPLDHISRIVVSYPDASDIKVPWELSRCQHLPLLAAAHRVTGDRRYLDELGQQLLAWIDANPVEFGVNWQCTMDAAIRAVNWVAAIALCAETPEVAPWLQPVVASLLLHARFIRANLESGPARGNHYLADVVGLLIVAGVFQGSEEGQRWIAWSVDQLGVELAHQIRADGCDHEASISYHRLVAEMFIVAAAAADVLAPSRLDPALRPAIERMLAFAADYTRPDGLAPQLGDADDGRLLPLADYGSADQRSHLHLFAQAGRPYRPASRSAGYRAGGFYFLRAGSLYAAVRCGDVGIYGRGCHAHNDLLAFELSASGIPLVVDPGSYLYTADPVARNAFRSTGAHSTLQVDDLEQNEIRLDRLFAMVDRAHAEVLAWEPGDEVTTFTGRHYGFATSADRCVHTRTLRLDASRGELAIVDELQSDVGHELTWRFPLAPSEVRAQAAAVRALFPGVTLEIEADGLECGVEEGWLSTGYGVRMRAPVVRLHGRSTPGAFRATVSLRIT
jgi:uncharacterized heparinase superfamily protein